MIRRTFFILTIAGSLLLAQPAVTASEAQSGGFSLEFNSGVEYDSTVAVLDLDQSSGESDVAALIELAVGFDKELTKRLDFNLGYNFSQSLHDEFDQFDIQIHRGSGGLGYDFGPLKLGGTFQYADAALAGDEYLVLEQASPYLSRLFGKRLYLRLAYARTEKAFTTSPDRDATADSPSLDAFVFLNGVKSYLVFGYQHHDEDAFDDQFDYTGSKVKAQLARRMGGDSREFTFKTGLRYESRDYRRTFLSIGEPRADERYRFDAQLDAPLGKRTFLRIGYEYADNRSNLSSVDFDEHVASIGIGAKL